MSQVEYIEGRRYAVEMIKSVVGMPRSMFIYGGGFETVIDNLKKTCDGKPPCYARGINSIIQISMDAANYSAFLSAYEQNVFRVETNV